MVQRSVAVVAVIVGVVTVFAGGRVLAGADPGYVVFRPLLLFNTIMGVVYIAAGWQVWRDLRCGRAWAQTIALLNLLALLAVSVAYAAGAGVAGQSLAAMSFRTFAWAGLFLTLSSAVRRAASSDARTADAADEAWVIRPVVDAPVTISSFYGVDHDEIDQLLEQFRASKAGVRPAALVLYREFKGRLERHIGWEEDILFPLFERLTGMTDNGPIVVMRAEHRAITRLLGSIDEALQQGDASIDADEAALMEVLSAHNWKEENILYPLIDRQVSVADREAVFARMHAESSRT